MPCKEWLAPLKESAINHVAMEINKEMICAMGFLHSIQMINPYSLSIIQKLAIDPQK